MASNPTAEPAVDELSEALAELGRRHSLSSECLGDIATLMQHVSSRIRFKDVVYLLRGLTSHDHLCAMLTTDGLLCAGLLYASCCAGIPTHTASPGSFGYELWTNVMLLRISGKTGVVLALFLRRHVIV